MGRARQARLAPVVGAVVSAVAGVALIAGSLQLPPSRTADVGGGRLPLLIGIAIMTMAFLYLIQQLRAYPDRLSEPEAAHTSSRAAILLGLLIAYCALISLVGMIVATAAFMMAVMLWLDGRARWLRSALTTVVFLSLISALFTWVIATPLP
jgi:lysylphosphatidylglycerol synthetase-like protein (DUF2156 family)